MNVAIIPARGGSKRIPKKNTKFFLGIPVIEYSIRAAVQSGCFDRIIVSTDDEDIADIAINSGAEVPFMRPKRLSGDYTATVPVVKHAVEYINTGDQVIDLACCIYATAPFIQVEDIRKSFDLISSRDYDYVFPVTSFPYPIQRGLGLLESEKVSMISPEYYESRSQDLVAAYHDVGQFYWGSYEAWTLEKPILTGKSGAVILPRHRVQDIDTLEDWKRAEILFKAIQLSE